MANCKWELEQALENLIGAPVYSDPDKASKRVDMAARHVRAAIGALPNAGAQSPAAFRERLARRTHLIGEILNGLDGHRFGWGDGEYTSKKKLLRELGIELVTHTALKKRGHRLRRGAQSVGTVYFPAPIQSDCDVYIFGVQTTERRP